MRSTMADKPNVRNVLEHAGFNRMVSDEYICNHISKA